MTDTNRPKRRTVRVRLDTSLIARMLALPDGASIVAVDSGNDPVHFDLILSSADFPEVEPDVCSPYARPSFQVVELDDGRPFLRLVDLGIPTAEGTR